jgi:hypothetical protein
VLLPAESALMYAPSTTPLLLLLPVAWNWPKCWSLLPTTLKWGASQEAAHMAAVLPDTRTGTPEQDDDRSGAQYLSAGGSVDECRACGGGERVVQVLFIRAVHMAAVLPHKCTGSPAEQRE